MLPRISQVETYTKKFGRLGYREEDSYTEKVLRRNVHLDSRVKLELFMHLEIRCTNSVHKNIYILYDNQRNAYIVLLGAV